MKDVQKAGDAKGFAGRGECGVGRRNVPWCGGGVEGASVGRRKGIAGLVSFYSSTSSPSYAPQPPTGQ